VISRNRTADRRQRVYAVALCCLLVFSVAVLTLESQSIWWDEGISLHLAGLSWAGIAADRAENIHPPLYYFLLKAWTSSTGRSPFAGRYLSALSLPLLAAAAARFIGRRINGRAARAAALLVAFAPPFVVYGQELRPYALLPLGALALWSLAWPAGAARTGPPAPTSYIAAGSRLRWVLCGLLLGVVQAALLLTHYAGAIAVGTATMIYGLRATGYAVRRDLNDPRHGEEAGGALNGSPLPTAREVLYEWALGMSVTLALVAPWAMLVVRTGMQGLTRQAGLGNLFSTPVPALYVAGLIGIFHTTGLPNALGDAGLVRPSLLLGGMLLAAIVQAAWRHRARLTSVPAHPSGAPLRRKGKVPYARALLLTLLLWLLPFASAPLLWWLSPQSHPRYLFPFVLGGWLVLGILVGDRGLARPLRYGLLSAGLAVSLLVLQAYLTDPAYARSDVRAVVSHLRAEAGPGDVVVVPDTDWSLLAYDLGAVTSLMAPRAFDWERDAAAFAEATSQANRVFVLDYGRGAVDPSGGLRAALTWAGTLVSRSTFPGVLLETYEMTAAVVGYPCEPLPPTCVAGSDLCVVGVAVQRAPVSGAALPVRVCWEGMGASGTVPRYGVALRLYGSQGVLIAAHNEVLVDSLGAPSDLWAAGGRASYHVVPLPVGLPPSPHQLELGLFLWEDPVGEVRLADQRNGSVTSVALGEVLPLVSPWRDASLYGLVTPSEAPADQVAPWANLEGVRLDRTQIAPGEPVYISTHWRVLALQPEGPWLQLALRRGDEVLVSVDAGSMHGSLPEGRPLMIVSALRVPAQASDGTVTVVAGVGDRSVVLGEIAVETADHLFTVPSIGYPVEMHAGDVATLVAYDLESSSSGRTTSEGGGAEGSAQPQVGLQAGNPVTLTLVWRAGSGASDRDLKVFTHLVAGDGHIVAQHDAVPVAWSRPTAGWIAGEVLVDYHPLTWQGPGFTGEARLLIGFYDERTGERVVWDDGRDAYDLPLIVEVQP
jgi:mannosyltransferase